MDIHSFGDGKFVPQRNITVLECLTETEGTSHGGELLCGGKNRHAKMGQIGGDIKKYQQEDTKDLVTPKSLNKTSK